MTLRTKQAGNGLSFTTSEIPGLTPVTITTSSTEKMVLETNLSFDVHNGSYRYGPEVVVSAWSNRFPRARASLFVPHCFCYGLLNLGFSHFVFQGLIFSSKVANFVFKNFQLNVYFRFLNNLTLSISVTYSNPFSMMSEAS